MEITHGTLLTGTHPRPASSSTHTLLSRAGHKVVRKAFAPGQGMPPHHAPHDVLAVVLSGEMRITLAGVAQTYVAGDYVVFPAGTEHALHCVQAAQVLIYL